MIWVGVVSWISSQLGKKLEWLAPRNFCGLEPTPKTLYGSNIIEMLSVNGHGLVTSMHSFFVWPRIVRGRGGVVWEKIYSTRRGESISYLFTVTKLQEPKGIAN